MFTSTNGPLLASLERDLARLKQQQKEEEEEIDGIDRDLKDVESTWKAIKAVLADAEKRQIREESVRLWLLELRGLAQKVEDLRDVYEYEVVAKEVEAYEAPPPPDTPRGEIWESYVSTNLGLSLHPKEVYGQGQAYRASSSSGDASTSKRRKVGSSMDVASLSPLLDASFREQIARELRIIKQEFEAIARRKEALHLKEADGCMHSSDKNDGFVRSESTDRVIDPVFLGRDQQLQQLLDLLIDNHGDSRSKENVEVIAVVGMGGIGKTTLAQHVCKDPQIMGHFDKIVWVHVSQNFDVVRLTKAVIEHFRGNSNLDNLSTLQDEAVKSMKDKKVLLVMDDVWNAKSEDWESFLVTFDNGPIKGSKILVTTRLSVAIRTKPVKIVDLSRLTEEDGWSLLKRHAFSNQSGDVNNIGLERIGRKIAVKCGGLPLSLKLLGGLLSYEKKEEVWKSVLESNLLDLSNLLDPSEGRDAGQKILAHLYLSYLHLSPKLQSCFKCCSKNRTPNGNILSEHLKQYWLAYDIVKDKRDATRCLVALVSRSFLEVFGDIRIVRMHDHIYDLAQYVQEEKKVNLPCDEVRPEELNEDHFSKAAGHVGCQDRLKCLRIVRIDMELIPVWVLQSYNLRYLEMRIRKLECLPDSIGNLRNLRWLSLRYSATKYLPEAISSLTNLQELNLSDTQICCLPESISNLVNLQELHLSHTQICCLPESISKLANLQELDLSYTSIECLPESISGVANLQELHLTRTRIECLPESISGLANLQELHLTRTRIGCLPESIRGLANLQELDLRYTNISCLPESISRLTKLKELCLSHSNISCLPESISKLANLQELRLNNCEELIELPEGIVNLTNLQILDLQRTGVSSMPKGIGALTKLTVLSRYVIGSEKADLRELKNMRNLEHVRIFNLCELVNEEDASQAEMVNKSHLHWLDLFWRESEARDDIYGYEYGESSWCLMPGDTETQVQRRNDDEIARRDERTLQCLKPHQNLSFVSICGYGGYRLPSWMGDESFSNLFQLLLGDIKCCTSLSPIDRLPSLGVLQLVHMYTLQELVPNCSQSATEPQQPFPNLHELHIYHCDSIELLPLHKFPSLEDVTVHRCANLHHMEPPYHVPCLLRDVRIKGCPNFKFPQDPQTSPPPAWKLHINNDAFCARDPWKDDENMTEDDEDDENMTEDDEDDENMTEDDENDAEDDFWARDPLEDDENTTDDFSLDPSTDISWRPSKDDENMTDADDSSDAAD